MRRRNFKTLLSRMDTAELEANCFKRTSFRNAELDEPEMNDENVG